MENAESAILPAIYTCREVKAVEQSSRSLADGRDAVAMPLSACESGTAISYQAPGCQNHPS